MEVFQQTNQTFDVEVGGIEDSSENSGTNDKYVIW